MFPMELGVLLAHCGHWVMQELGKNLQDCSLTPMQGWVIHYITLAEQENQVLSQKQLEEKLRRKPSTVNGVVERLEQNGYLLRKQSPSDGRCKLLYPTQKAHAFQANFDAAVQQTEAQLSRHFTAEERQLLQSLLLRIFIHDSEKEVFPL